MKKQTLEIITPNWPLGKKIKAFTTTRFGGVSENEYFSFNLGGHVGDHWERVMKNRQLLVDEFELPEMPVWLNQTQSGRCLELPLDPTLYDDYLVNWQITQQHPELKDESSQLAKLLNADAVYTQSRGTVACILTADCFPVLLANQSETAVAAVHAGWRATLNNIVQNTVFAFKEGKADFKNDPLYAWIGPGIGPKSFIVGPEVVAKFMAADEDFIDYFTPYTPELGKWLGDLQGIISLILQKCGVDKKNIYMSDIDTFTDNRFFSYRRERVTGRFASLIYIDDQI